MPIRPPVHRRPRGREHRTPSTRSPDLIEFYASTRWRKLARWFLACNPLCTDPFGWHQTEGRTEPATEVHHVVPLRVDIHQGLDMTNLMAVCSGCHARLDAESRRKYPNATEGGTNDVIQNGNV